MSKQLLISNVLSPALERQRFGLIFARYRIRYIWEPSPVRLYYTQPRQIRKEAAVVADPVCRGAAQLSVLPAMLSAHLHPPPQSLDRCMTMRF